jgi:hypothetical protein
MDTCTIVLQSGYTVDVQGAANEVAEEVIDTLNPDDYASLLLVNAKDGRDVYLLSGSVLAVIAHAM